MTDHPPETIIRHAALALRDFAELLGAGEASVTIDELVVTYSTDDGIHLLPPIGSPAGEPIDITDWVDQIGLVAA